MNLEKTQSHLNALPTNTHHHVRVDPLVIALIEQNISLAIRGNSSDLHFEVNRDHSCVRIRVDGVLQAASQVKALYHQQIITRLKILAGLDISNRRTPQDGKFIFQDQHVISHIRINTCPTHYGEKAVLRLLNPENKLLPLNQLGIPEAALKSLKQALRASQGLILITGPTGSGKSTTLYACLDSLNSPHINIMTIEDPIEMNLNGINQIAINPKHGLNFDACLKALLRQDPDVIMLGEIRDTQSAQFALKSAQTGHLVLASLHTPSCIATLYRLETLGIDKHQLSNCLKVVIAQRLLRRCCAHCQGQGCSQCHEGYAGRMGIYEALFPDYAFYKLWLDNASGNTLIHYLKNNQFKSLEDHAYHAIEQGQTTIDELYRTSG
jgi:protein transport protein HofB